jgi:hypothetical protein
LLSTFITSISTYQFVVPDVCVLDSEQAGNWTRFINSSCRPNVKTWANYVGKRHVVFFQALKEIGPEEELFFSYGQGYFEAAAFECRCDVLDRPHMPREVPQEAKKQKKSNK